MRRLRLSGFLSLSLITSFLFSAGCGGGGTESESAGVIVSGRVTVDSRGRADTPVANADTRLINDDNNTIAATTITNADGNFTFQNVEPGSDYRIEVEAEDPLSGEPFTLTTVVSPEPEDAGQHLTRNCDEATTVAARAALERLQALKEQLPEVRVTIQQVADDIVQAVRRSWNHRIDLKDDEAVENAIRDTLQQTGADGCYAGVYTPVSDDTLGTRSPGQGVIGIIVNNGYWALVGFEQDSRKAAFASGRIDEKGNILGIVIGSDGRTKIAGVCSNGVISGTWVHRRSDETTVRGVWKAVKLTNPLAGLYAGRIVHEELETTEDNPPTHWVMLITDESDVFIGAGSPGEGRDRLIFLKGTLSNGSVIINAIDPESGDTLHVEGGIGEDGSASGTFESRDSEGNLIGSGTWSGRRRLEADIFHSSAPPAP